MRAIAVLCLLALAISAQAYCHTDADCPSSYCVNVRERCPRPLLHPPSLHAIALRPNPCPQPGPGRLWLPAVLAANPSPSSHVPDALYTAGWGRGALPAGPLSGHFHSCGGGC